MWKKLLQMFENDNGTMSWGRIGSFLCVLFMIIFTFLVWKYGKIPDMKVFVDFAKEITTKLGVLAGSLYGASKVNDAFGTPGSINKD